jgi:hypothetical protein
MCLLGCSPAARAQETAPPLKPYPGSTEFCGESIVGAPQPDGRPGAHITWTAYRSDDPPSKVVAYYLKRLGAKNRRRERSEDVWRFPLDSPDRVLSVSGPTGTFPWRKCGALPPAVQSVIMISTIARPR